VKKDLPVKSMAELVSYAKAIPENHTVQRHRWPYPLRSRTVFEARTHAMGTSRTRVAHPDSRVVSGDVTWPCQLTDALLKSKAGTVRALA